MTKTAKIKVVHSADEAVAFAKIKGFPIRVEASFSANYREPETVRNEGDLRRHVGRAIDGQKALNSPILVELHYADAD